MALAAALAGGLLAMLIVVIAPGNQVRQGLVGTQADLVANRYFFNAGMRRFIFGKYFLNTPFWAFLSLELAIFSRMAIYFNRAASLLPAEATHLVAGRVGYVGLWQ